jgi:beta-lactam-binding protein with PASTA domain
VNKLVARATLLACAIIVSGVSFAAKQDVIVPDWTGLSIRQIAGEISATTLVIGTSTEEFSDTIAATLVISHDPLPGASVPEGTAVDFVVSKGPENPPRQVPYVTNRTQEDAEILLNLRDLVLGTVTEEFSDIFAEGVVISQDPVAGELVPEGTVVNIVLSKGPEFPTEQVPDVIGRTLVSAESHLILNGLVLGTVTEEFSDTVLEDIVISQDPLAGVIVPSDSPVDLVVSKGPAFPATVPDLTDLPLAEAETDLAEASLTLGTVTVVQNSVIPEGIVISQSPISGTTVPAGSAVDLTISSGPSVVPDLVGLTRLEAEALLRQNFSFSVGTVTEQLDEDVPEGIIISQDPAAGTQVPGGSATIDIVISMGPTLDLEIPNVVGLRVDEAENVLLSFELTLGALTTAASDTVPVGYVISQNPIEGAQALRGTPVNLVISSGPLTRGELIPDVVGQNLFEARQTLALSGYPLGTVTLQPSDTISNGIVISQDPAAGDMLTGRGGVNLVVASESSNSDLTIPDVVGLGVDAAEIVLLSNGFALGNLTTAASDIVPVGVVSAQDPPAGAQVPPFTPINLVISSGSATSRGTVPDLVGLSLLEAEQTLVSHGFSLGTVTMQPSDTVSEGDVISQDPPAGTRLGRGGGRSGGDGVNLVVSSPSSNSDRADVNSSGAVDAVDVQLVINGALSGGSPDTDINLDALTNAVDVQLVINAALGV